MSAAFDLATYIADTLSQGTVGTDIRVNDMTELPAAQIVVYEYGGRYADLGMGNPDVDALENPNCQVAVRNKRPDTAQATAYLIYNSLDGKGSLTINGVAYLFLRAMQPPFLLERDKASRVTFAFNVEVQKRRSIDSSVASFVYKFDDYPLEAPNGARVAFTMRSAPISGSVIVYQNEHNVTGNVSVSGSIVTFVEAPLAGDRVRFAYRIPGTTRRIYHVDAEALTATANARVFQSANMPAAGTNQVFVGGQYQASGVHYTFSGASNDYFAFTDPPAETPTVWYHKWYSAEPSTTPVENETLTATADPLVFNTAYDIATACAPIIVVGTITMQPDTDFTETGLNEITFTDPPASTPRAWYRR